MATALSSLETQVRYALNEPTARFWTSAELIGLMNLGVRDLWRGVNDLRQKHFCTVDITNVSLAADAVQLTGVPADCVRVHMLEPRDLSGTTGYLRFEPLPYNHPKFQAARASDSQDATSGGIVYWDQTDAGGPVGAPTIRCAPKLTAAVNLALTYVPSLAALTAASTNPIPGESDNAIIAWTIAYARAKEREDRAPDAGWLTIYGTEKQNILVSLSPRQDQEPQIASAVFEEMW